MARSDNRFSFTVKSLNAVTCPVSGKPDKSDRTYVYDADEPGLAFRVTETGTRSFYAYGTVNGKDKRVKLATVAEVDGNALLEARKKARVEVAKMRDGVDPIQTKRERIVKAAKIVHTLSDLWEAYRSEHLVNKRPSTQKEFTRLYDAHLAQWKNRPLVDITKDECQALHKKIGRTTKYSANRVKAILSAMFRGKGSDFGLPEDWTPTTKIKRFDEDVRDRVLSPEELAAVLNAIDADENDIVRDFFRMILYTGSRRGKLAEMKWQEISIQRRTWTVPGILMKNNMPLVVNLVDDAIAMLKRRADCNATDSPFVFPSRTLTADQVMQVRTLRDAGKATREIARDLGISQSSVMRASDPGFKADAPKPFNGAAKAWHRILQRAKITTRTTPHDLRRTYVTNLLESGAALMHVAAAVGHRNPATTSKHYSVARQDKVADAVRVGVASMMGEAAAAQATMDGKRNSKAG